MGAYSNTICPNNHLVAKTGRRHRIVRGIAFGITFSLLWLLAACSSPTPTIIPATPPPIKVVITALTALAQGRLIQSGGCLYIHSADFDKNYALVWPPDFAITIDGENVKVVSGIVTGIRKEVVLQIGENLVLGGGDFNPFTSENQKLIPAGCPGPYWVVGSIVSHGP